MSNDLPIRIKCLYPHCGWIGNDDQLRYGDGWQHDYSTQLCPRCGSPEVTDITEEEYDDLISASDGVQGVVDSFLSLGQKLKKQIQERDDEHCEWMKSGKVF